MRTLAWRAVALLLVASFVAGCSRSDPEKNLRAEIAAMETAVEEGKVSAFVGHLADDFTRDSGGFDKQDARRMLAAALLRNQNIQLTLAISDLRVDGTRAFAKVRVLATGGAGLIPERGQTWEFDTAWRLEGGRWKLFNAEWREGL